MDTGQVWAGTAQPMRTCVVLKHVCFCHVCVNDMDFLFHILDVREVNIELSPTCCLGVIHKGRKHRNGDKSGQGGISVQADVRILHNM